MGRRRTPRMPGLNVTHHTLAKIKRIGLRHLKSPPTGSESHSHPRWNPQRFNLTVRCSSVLFDGSAEVNSQQSKGNRGRSRGLSGGAEGIRTDGHRSLRPALPPSLSQCGSGPPAIREFGEAPEEGADSPYANLRLMVRDGRWLHALTSQIWPKANDSQHRTEPSGLRR